jgi:hypothetical protein
MLNDLLLLSGNDIPFPEARLVIHQPTIKEIAYIGEEAFFNGCEFLKFTKNNLPEEDRSRLENITNFEILMSIMKEKNPVSLRNKTCVQMILSLLFPTYEIQLDFIGMQIKFTKGEESFSINKQNFETFKSILDDIFCLGGSKSDYNPSGEMARKIAEKLRARQQKLAQAKGNQKVAILSRYVSILAVGENKDMNQLFQYTVYQLFDEFGRYQLKIQSDLYIDAQLAGAKGSDEVEDWMKDIHSDVDDDLGF